jgi:DNA invertase Pin-like site-specific DNA recombinase
MRRVIGYIRVSSIEQGKSGFGLQVQEAQIKGFAEAAGYRIVRVYSEAASVIDGDSLDRRPELREALRKAKRSHFPILVPDFDRVSREANELEEIVGKSGVKIISARFGPGADPVVIHGEAARIEIETKLLKERTREGLRQAKLRGAKFGNRTNLPDAQRKGALANRRKADQRRSELEVVIKEIQDSGAKSGAEIAAELNKRGMLTTRGLKWTEANLWRVLRGIKATTQNRDQDRHHPNWGMF